MWGPNGRCLILGVVSKWVNNCPHFTTNLKSHVALEALVEYGVRHLVLCSRSGRVSADAPGQLLQRLWRCGGSVVEKEVDDPGNGDLYRLPYGQCYRIFKMILEMGISDSFLQGN